MKSKAPSMERLAASLRACMARAPLAITVFDASGRFGAGATHSDAQARTSYMNRVASQIAFACDESNMAARHLLPPSYRRNFYQWARAKFAQTGERRYDLRPTDVPHRYLHGEALRDMFELYAGLLRAQEDVHLEVVAATVGDIAETEDGSGLIVETATPNVQRWYADQVLLVTGHSENHPEQGSLSDRLACQARNVPGAAYVKSAYPLNRTIPDHVAPPGSTVGLLGLGLTAVDVILHLTEGRGGRFEDLGKNAPGLPRRYRPSGSEPRSIVVVSPSGLFPFCRPENHKAADGTGFGHVALEHRGIVIEECLEHKGVFLTTAAIRRLRRTVGMPAHLDAGTVRQLDFERHVFPLVVLWTAASGLVVLVIGLVLLLRRISGR